MLPASGALAAQRGLLFVTTPTPLSGYDATRTNDMARKGFLYYLHPILAYDISL